MFSDEAEVPGLEFFNVLDLPGCAASRSDDNAVPIAFSIDLNLSRLITVNSESAVLYKVKFHESSNSTLT